ncbi:MAG: alpha/beta fold hydrolase [Novosphingobium sp.]
MADPGNDRPTNGAVWLQPVTLPDLAEWVRNGLALQAMLIDFQAERMTGPAAERLLSPADGSGPLARLFDSLPFARLRRRQVADALQLGQVLLGQLGIGPMAARDGAPAGLARRDARFADRKWRAHPLHVLIHQAYLLWSERLLLLVDEVPGLDANRREQLRFAARTVAEALSPANFATTNPVVVERTLASKGANLVTGLKHLLRDVRRGQITHTDPDAFAVGRDIATTPGKVVHQTALYQLIHYTPTTPEVMTTPLVIFPPWINRFYILDLNEKKSLVRWLLDNGVSVFMVSWKSADASIADVTADDYVKAQIDAIDHVRQRLQVPSANAVGYCVAGSHLAMALALLARRGEADKVRSATFFTAQVDFENAGELKLLIDEQPLAMMDRLAKGGSFDGRYMSATFNLLRSSDLIWQYVIDHYLLGKDYRAFDLLHWNGDTTNLPWKWHKEYLTTLYRDNRMVEPNSLTIDGTPIDLTRIETPAYVQAGREDHIAPPESVWRMNRHFKGPLRFVLAGSGHIAGVVNPPAGGKYQYWTNPAKVATFEDFVEGAVETKGSWWPNWLEWLRQQDSSTVPATGKRAPGGRGDRVIEDAPGRYVLTR